MPYTLSGVLPRGVVKFSEGEAAVYTDSGQLKSRNDEGSRDHDRQHEHAGAACSAVPGSSIVTVIEPSRGWVPIRLGELWEYREVLYYLVWRDIKVRYRQTIIGAAWAIIQPLMTMVVFSVFLGKLAKVPSDGVPYPVFAFAALVPWAFFANGLTQSAEQPGRERPPDHEGLLSAPARADGPRPERAAGHRPVLPRAARSGLAGTGSST